jgi:hypothetical protein
MALPLCEHYRERDASSSLRLTEGPMWLCHTCYSWGERRLYRIFAEPTRGDLFAPDDA